MLSMDIITIIITTIGILAFVTSVVTEITKSLPGICRIPTVLQVLITSVIFTVIASLFLIDHYNIRFVWYYPIAAVIGGFIVAFISLYGWEKITEVYNKFKK